MVVKREALFAAAVAVLGVVAIAVAAATLADRWFPDGGTGDPGHGIAGPAAEPPPEPTNGLEIPYFDMVVMVLVIALILVTVIYLIKNHREHLPLLVGVVAVAALVYVLIDRTDPIPEPFDQEEPRDWIPGSGGEIGQSFPADDQIDWLPVTAVLAILGLVLVAAITMNVRRGAPEIEPRIEEDASGVSDEVATHLGEAAGRAADRIETTEAYENEVYRAWAEMTELLDLSNPEFATPGDFAAEAVEVGLAPSDVRGLTQLFEAVRYGNRSATADRERRAVSLLRRIESRYVETE